jgi:drug/metabolite transporter (DMT)-like permease
MHHLMFALICLFWGSNFIMMKKAGISFSALSISAWRLVGGAIMLLLIWLILRQRGHEHWPIRRNVMLPLILVGLLGSVYPYTMQPYLIVKYQDSAFFGIMVAFVPLLTVLVSGPMLGVWPHLRQFCGVMLGLLCTIMLLDAGYDREVAWHDLLLGVSIPLSYAVSNTLVKRSLAELAPVPMTLSILSMSAALVLPVALLTEPPAQLDAPPLFWPVLALAGLGVLGTGSAYFMFLLLIQQRGPLYAGVVTYVIPVGALLFGWLDHESITASQVGALLGILISVALVQWPERHAVRQAASPNR